MRIEQGDTPDWQQPGLLAGLDVCLACFGLRGEFKGREHRCSCTPRDDDWRSRHWEGYDIAAHVDLCHLCARNTMKSGSRYTWYVCDLCRQVNQAVGAVLGSKKAGAVPLGRHSLMNGVSLSTAHLDEASVNAFKDALKGLTSIWRRLSDWRESEATRLIDSIDQRGASMSLNDWLTRFPACMGASVDSFCRFVEFDLPRHPDLEALSAERQRFLEEGTSRADRVERPE